LGAANSATVLPERPRPQADKAVQESARLQLLLWGKLGAANSAAVLPKALGREADKAVQESARLQL
jgi:hypothetical protein